MVNTNFVFHLWELLFERPIQKLVILLVVSGVFLLLSNFFEELLSQNPFLNIVLVVLNIAFAVYFILLIVRVIFVYLINRQLERLLQARSIFSLLFSYAVFVFGILLVISLFFMQVTQFNLGYLTYGQCSDNFSSSLIKSDKQISRDYFYFSAVTFFTIGYGDICPMGLTKLVSILTAFIGNIVTVVLMGIVITLYLNRQNQKDERSVRKK